MTEDGPYISPLRWVRLAVYCQISGDTADAVHARRRKRQWIDGVQCRVGPDGNLWVNPGEVNKWIESSNAQPLQGGPATSSARVA